jgi:tetratricopeptide (TPR) repeat protein
MPDAPKVFISYSHDSPAHAERVLAFADQLRAHGVTAVIDQYEPSPREGWPRWMQNQMKADFIVLICTPTYHERALGEQTDGNGHGVQWEGNLIYNRIYHHPEDAHRFIPVLLSGSGAVADIPEPIQGSTFFTVTEPALTDSGYLALYRRITGQPATPAQPVGDLVILRAVERIRPVNAKPWNVPHQRNELFTGRADVLRRLHSTLASGKTAALNQAAISGMGGIGKTQTAVEYAYRHRDDYSAVLWLRADSWDTLLSSFSEVARLLALPEADAPDQNAVVAAVHRWLQSNFGWLLILDNADDVTILRRALPTGLSGHVLITTRERSLSGIAEAIRIEKLPPDEGAAFLLRRANILPKDAPLSAAFDEDRTAALSLSDEMDGLPLALDQAGAYIEETPTTPAKYLPLFRTYRDELLKSPGTINATDHVSVSTTFTLALTRVEQAHPASADLLRLCAFLAPDAIPEEILTEGAEDLGDVLGPVMQDDLARGETIRWASRWSLLEYDAREGSLTVHRLVQAVVRETIDAADAPVWAERAVLAVNSAFPVIKFVNWLRCERLLPHARICAWHIEEYGILTAEAGRLLHQAARYMHSIAQFAAAEPLYKCALTIDEKVYNMNHPEVATDLNNLALLYCDQADYAAAEPLLRRALAIREWEFGPEHPQTAVSLHDLAVLHYARGDYAAAEPLYIKVLTVDEEAYGPEHPEVATDLNNLGLLYFSQGDLKAAEPLLKRAMVVREKVLGNEHPHTAESLNNMALVYYDQGNHTAAESFFKRALAIREKALGSEHPDSAQSLNNLARLCEAQGDYAAAEPLYKRALAIFKAAMGPEHPDTVDVCENYAALLHKMQ